MPRQQYLPAHEPEIEDLDGEFDEQKPTQEMLDLFGLVDDFQQAEPKSQIKVYSEQVEPTGKPGAKPLAYLFYFNPGQLDSTQLLEKIRDEYGPGTYQFQVWLPRPQENNRLRMATKQSFTIGMSAEQKNENLPFARRKSRGDGESVSDLMHSFSELIERQNQRSENLIREVMGKNNSSGLDFKGIVELAAIALPLIKEFLPERQAPKTMIEQMQELAMMKEIAEALGGGGPSIQTDNPWIALMEKFGPVLAGALSGAQNPTHAHALQQMPPQLLPNPNAQMQPKVTVQPNPPAQIPQTKQDQQTMTPEMQEMKTNIETLVGYAGMKLPPEFIAAQILENTPEDKESELLEFIGGKDCIEKMARLVPEVLQHLEFFQALQTHILDAFEDEPEMTEADKRFGQPHYDHDSDNAPDLPDAEKPATLAGDEASKSLPD